VAVAALEPAFYAALLEGLELVGRVPDRADLSSYDVLREVFAARFRARTLREWIEVFAGTDACVAPVLTPDEAAVHPHVVARETFVELDGLRQPAPAPRFSRTPGALRAPPSPPGADTVAALTAWGIANVAELVASGVAAQT
jgi:alpha-methylacyl-CoA racemase